MMSDSVEAIDAEWAAVEDLMINWHRRAREGQISNYEAADEYLAYNRRLGVPAAILGVGVGTSVFAHMGTTWGLTGEIITGIVSIGAAVLAGLQTFLAYAERAEKHRAAGVRYGAARRDLEQTAALLPQTRGDVRAYLDGIRKQLDDIAAQSPEVPRIIWLRAKDKISGDEASPLFPARLNKGRSN